MFLSATIIVSSAEIDEAFLEANGLEEIYNITIAVKNFVMVPVDSTIRIAEGNSELIDCGTVLNYELDSKRGLLVVLKVPEREFKKLATSPKTKRNKNGFCSHHYHEVVVFESSWNCDLTA